MKSIAKHMHFLMFFLLPFFTFAQDVLQPEWVIRKASTVESGNAEAWGIDFDSNGNLYWATNQTRPGFLQGLDIVFYKLDQNGDEIWPAPTIYAGQHHQQIYKVTATDSIIYIGGRNCTQFTLDPDLPFCDMLIIAVDAASGDTLWATTWDRGFGYEEADGIVVKDDGIYISGWSVGDNTDTDLGLMKLNFDGEIAWSNGWGTDGRDHQDGHSVVDDSVIYAAGLIGGPINPGLCLIKDYNGKALLAKFSRENGAYLDHVEFGRSDPWCNFENALGMASNGELLYVVGVTSIASDDIQIFLKAFDKNLKMIWETEWGGSDAEAARAIALGEDGSIYIGGNTKSYGAGDLDVVLLKFSPEGNLIWYKTWGSAKEDNVLDIGIDGDFIYATGKTNSFHSSDKFEAFLLKTKADIGTAVEDQPSLVQDYFLHPVHPNPFNPETTIRFRMAKYGHVKLTVHAITGQLIRTLANHTFASGAHRIMWDGTDNSGRRAASGNYILTMQAGEFVQTRKLTLLK